MDTSGAIGDPTMESGDWRAQLQADSRPKILNKIMDTLKTHLPFSGPEELKKIAVRFEEKIYTAATTLSDYLRKISLLAIEAKYLMQQNVIDHQKELFQEQKAVPDASSTSLNSTSQTGNPNGEDWQEDVYQKIKAMKDMYLLDLKDMHENFLSKLQQRDSLPQQPKNEQFEKLKLFKNVLERYIQFLETPKHGILDSHKDKLVTYEKQITNVINSNRRKPAAPQAVQMINRT